MATIPSRQAFLGLLLLLGLVPVLSSPAFATSPYVYRQLIPTNPLASDDCPGNGSRSFTTPGTYTLNVPSGCPLQISVTGAGETSSSGGYSGGTLQFSVTNGGIYNSLDIQVGQGGLASEASSGNVEAQAASLVAAFSPSGNPNYNDAVFECYALGGGDSLGYGPDIAESYVPSVSVSGMAYTPGNAGPNANGSVVISW